MSLYQSHFDVQTAHAWKKVGKVHAKLNGEPWTLKSETLLADAGQWTSTLPGGHGVLRATGSPISC